MSIYVIAEYLRLSSEDVDLKNTQKTESNSISNVSVKSLCIKKPAARSRPGNGVKTIMVCKKRERSRAAGTAQHPVEPDPSLVQRTRAKSGSDKDLSHSQWRSG